MTTPTRQIWSAFRKQKDQRVRFTASRTSLRMLLAAWGQKRGRRHKSADAGPLPRLHPVRPTGPGPPLKDVCITAGVPQMAADVLQRLDRQARVENGH